MDIIEKLKEIFAWRSSCNEERERLREENKELKKKLAEIEEWVDKIYKEIK